MIRNGLRVVNGALACLTILLLLMAGYYYLGRQSAFDLPDVAAVRPTLPRRAFEQPSVAYLSIGKPLMHLKFAPAEMQLPDLRKKILYYGKNSRPDATENQTFLHFDFVGGKAPVSVRPGEKLYLTFDPSAKPSGYAFSPGNKETSLWLEAKPDLKGAAVQVRMRGQEGAEIATPESHSRFTLPEKEYNRFTAAPWQLDKWRVDGSLFARQRARWYGKDEFLLKHGGDEYAEFVGKERVDFGEADEAYSVFVGPGSALVWEKQQWKQVEPGLSSLGKPLLLIKKIEDRIMNCELWDTEGKSKINLNLLRCVEAWIPHYLEKNFKFVGAHTRSSFAFEVNKKRVMLSPDDWLVLTPKGWIKLDTRDLIDSYVQRRLSGPLFVFEGVGKKEDKQVLMGTLFNASRTESKEIELAMTKSVSRPSEPKAVELDDDAEDDDDFEDDDDDDEDEGDEAIYPEPTAFGAPEEYFD